MNTKKYIAIIAIVTSFVGILSPSFADAAKVSVKDAIPTTADLVKSCTKVTSAPDQNGEVDIDTANIALPLVYIFKPQSFTSYVYNRATNSTVQLDYYACDATQLSEIQIQNSSLGGLPRFILSATSWIFSWINWLMAFVLKFLGSLLITMVAQGQYITNPIVASAWPFVQGIANLGFIIALLYIAFATTLRLESVATSVQRLLPKLLIAALLVNFSLVIGGLLIDASRVVMAVEINLMGNGDVNGKNFGDKLIAGTQALNQEIYSMKNQLPNNSFLATMVRISQGTFFLFFLTLGIGVIAINLLVRYIALIILLMISPLAYLFLALPKTAGYASQWWGMFIKWLLYGPIVLFFLLIIIRVQNIAPSLPQDPNQTSSDSWVPFFNAILHFTIVITLFFVANSLGKKVAGVGSDLAMGFANKTGAWARKNPKKAAFAAAGLLTGGGATAAGLALAGTAGGVMAGQSRSARDFYKGVGDNLKGNKAIAETRKFFGYDKHDKDGNLLPGKSTLGSSLASTTTDRLNTKKRDKLAAIPNTINASNVQTLTSAQLGDADILEHIAKGSGNIKNIIENGSQAQRLAIAGNKEYIAQLKPEDMTKLQTSISSLAPKEAVAYKAAVPAQPEQRRNGFLIKAAVPAQDEVTAQAGLSEKDKTDILEKIGKTVRDLKK